MRLLMTIIIIIIVSRNGQKLIFYSVVSLQHNFVFCLYDSNVLEFHNVITPGLVYHPTIAGHSLIGTVNSVRAGRYKASRAYRRQLFTPHHSEWPSIYIPFMIVTNIAITSKFRDAGDILPEIKRDHCGISWRDKYYRCRDVAIIVPIFDLLFTS